MGGEESKIMDGRKWKSLAINLQWVVETLGITWIFKARQRHTSKDWSVKI